MTIPILLSSSAHVIGSTIGNAGPLVDQRSLQEFSTDHLMDLAKKRSKRSGVFDTNPPYFWRAEVSNDRIDSYFTRMHESTLTNFAKAAAAPGVSFQYSHDWKRLGLGYSLEGQFEQLGDTATTDGTKEKSMRTVIDFYTIPGIKLNSEMGTDDFINAVDAGILNDVSVGFYADAITCSICGGDMYSGWFGMFGLECNHWPGDTYHDPYTDSAGNAYGGDVLCYAWVQRGTLSEVSQVYDGATPDAGLLKAQIWASEGKLDGRAIQRLEQRYRVKLPNGGVVVTVPGLGARESDMGVTKVKKRSEEDKPVVLEEEVVDTELEQTTDADNPGDEEEDTEDERAMLDDLQARYSGRGLTLGTSARSTIESLADLVLTQRTTIGGLEKRAKDGDAYRKSLVDGGLRSAAAAFGTSYDETVYRSMLERGSVEEIAKMAEGFEAIASSRFPAGRKSAEGDPDKPVVAESSGDDDKHYR